MSQELVGLIARRFIQNRAVKAIQFSNGDYVPDFKMKDPTRHGLGFTVGHLQRHLTGSDTYGHYLLDAESQCRMFAFDIDLKDEGNWVYQPNWDQLSQDITEDEWREKIEVHEGVDPQALWHDRTQGLARDWYKKQMMELARKFAAAITEIGVDCATAYSGNKGVHAYGFTGPIPAEEVREGAMCVMDMLDDFEPAHGKNFFRHKNLDPENGYTNFSVEVFPKQVNLEGKKLGNLMRLPLGKNQKSPDPTFFLDLKAPDATMRPHPNPVELLQSGNAYV